MWHPAGMRVFDNRRRPAKMQVRGCSRLQGVTIDSQGNLLSPIIRGRCRSARLILPLTLIYTTARPQTTSNTRTFFTSVTMSPPPTSQTTPKIWWSNIIFFLSVHVAAALGIYYKPPSVVPWPTLGLFFFLWQSADFG